MAFGESTMSRTQVHLCYNRFKEGREDVNDDADYAHYGRPNTSRTDKNMEAVKKIILDNSRIAIKESADDVGIKRAAAKTVPKLLNFEQKIQQKKSQETHLLRSIFHIKFQLIIAQ